MIKCREYFAEIFIHQTLFFMDKEMIKILVKAENENIKFDMTTKNILFPSDQKRNSKN